MPPPRNLDELENNLRTQVENLDPNMVTRALADIRNRAQLCLDANGGYFEKWKGFQCMKKIEQKIWSDCIMICLYTYFSS